MPSETQSEVHTEPLPVTLPEAEALPLLEFGEIIRGQRIAWGSNYTFLVHINAGCERYLRAIYKPRQGEQSLYDFPEGTLFKRERAAYLVSRTLGWPSVPTTVIREGPYGVGSLHLFVDSDPHVTYFDVAEERRQDLIAFAVFDVISNNADRKGGHCLLGKDGTIWSIDHGLTFHEIFKLRTVMVELWGAPIPSHLQADVQALSSGLDSQSDLLVELSDLITDVEVDALRRRLGDLIEDPVVPQLDPSHHIPWPLI